MGMTGILKSQVSGLCGKFAAFLDRPLEDEWPYLAGCYLCESASSRSR